MFIATGYSGNRPIPTRSLDFSFGTYLEMSDADFGSISTTKLSFSFYVKSTLSADIYPIVAQGNIVTPGSSASFLIYHYASGKIVAEYYNGSTSNYFVSSNTLSDSVWKRVVVHIDAGNATSTDRIKMWLNGVAESPSSYSAPSTSMNNSTQAIQIAPGYTGVAIDKLYQLGIYNDYLVTDAEIYNSGIKDIRGISGLKSTIHTDYPNITDDYLLSAAWTNAGGVSLSADIPS